MSQVMKSQVNQDSNPWPLAYLNHWPFETRYTEWLSNIWIPGESDDLWRLMTEILYWNLKFLYDKTEKILSKTHD